MDNKDSQSQSKKNAGPPLPVSMPIGAVQPFQRNNQTEKNITIKTYNQNEIIIITHTKKERILPLLFVSNSPEWYFIQWLTYNLLNHPLHWSMRVRSKHLHRNNRCLTSGKSYNRV